MSKSIRDLMEAEENQVWDAVCKNSGCTAWGYRNMLNMNTGLYLGHLVRSGKIRKIHRPDGHRNYFPNFAHPQTCQRVWRIHHPL